MAEVGKIYYDVEYGQLLTPASDYDTVYLSGNQSAQTNFLWDQLNDNRPYTDRPVWYTDGGREVGQQYKIVVLDDIMPISLERWFAQMVTKVDSLILECSSIVGFNYIDTSFCTNLHETFYGFPNFNAIGDSNFQILLNWDTSNVINMNSTFFNADYKNSRPRNFSFNWDTSKVTDFSKFFWGAEDGLINRKMIDVSKFDTTSAIYMSEMFENLHQTELDISSFIIDKVTTTENMFKGSSLITIYAHPNADWNSSAVLTTSTGMFTGCSNLVGGNGTEHKTSTATADNNKTRARIDKEGQAGYFTVARRTVTASATGNGSVSGAGEYDYGTIVDITATPESGVYYIDSVSKTTSAGTDILLDEDSVGERTFSFTLTRNTDISAVFGYRNEHELTITKRGGDYKVAGAGTYRYLDRPTLITDMNEGLIIFTGWLDSNGEVVSTRNPYTFTMPDEDVSLIAAFGESPFEDVQYRQFILVNGNGELFKLAYPKEKEFLDITDGLGFVKDLSTFRIGNSEEVQFEQYAMPEPKGTLYFYADGNSNVYKQYNEFIRGIMVKPLTLWYKIPIEDTDFGNVFHIPVEVTEIGKIDIEPKTGALECPISFKATEFWKETETSTDISTAIYNGGDFPCVVVLTITKQDGTFDNPEIRLRNVLEDNVYYGKCSLSGTFLRIVLDTKNKEEHLELYDENNQLVDAPFNFIDFSKSDGTTQFPFPKLNNGVSTEISIDYDNINENDVVDILVVFDKEYVSV